MDAIAILFGWPSLVAALLLAAVGILRRRPGIVAIGAILSLPIALYIASSPGYPLLGLIAPVSLGVASWRCAQRPFWLAVAAAGVYLLFLSWLLYVVVVLDNP